MGQWHQVGTAVRDAQEIGLHRDQFDPQPGPDDNTEKALEAVWDAQQRRRIWMTLVGWDLHTGAVVSNIRSSLIPPFTRLTPSSLPSYFRFSLFLSLRPECGAKETPGTPLKNTDSG